MGSAHPCVTLKWAAFTLSYPPYPLWLQYASMSRVTGERFTDLCACYGYSSFCHQFSRLQNHGIVRDCLQICALDAVMTCEISIRSTRSYNCLGQYNFMNRLM